ncbi:hypothetical protein FDECE_9504 [Fusarium decemcellulare]|nr:hypothetical protein FDECE_9504 [Fusarium decemcellulare]
MSHESSDNWPSSASRTKNLSTQHTTPSHLFDLAALIAFTAAATLILYPLNQSSPLNLAAMEPDTRATTSFEKDSSKTKDTNPKGKSRSSSLLMISSGFTFLAALPQQRSSTSSSFSLFVNCPLTRSVYLTICHHVQIQQPRLEKDITWTVAIARINMKEFRSFCSNRRPLEFHRLHEDLPDEFYELHFNQIFIEIYALVHKAFCPDKATQAPKPSPWLKGYSDEFIKYVQLLAHPDPRAGKWDRLLRDKAERSCLLQAIIFKVLDSRVFSKLLFGAGSDHEGLLQRSDAAFIDAEGFQRSSLRAQTNQLYLKDSRGEPPRFWDEVDRLCAQTLALLLPAYIYVAEFEGHEPVPISELHQALHEVIAYAGWLNVCIRMSSAVVSYNWVIPGEPYSMDQVNLCHEAYESSKKAAQHHQQRLKERKPSGQQMGSTARIKISVTPEIIRHKPVPESLGRQGMTSYTIMKPHVVYYEGLELDKDERRAFISLPDYIDRLRNRSLDPRTQALLIMLAVLLVLLVCCTPYGQRAGQDIWSWVQRELGLNPEPKPEPMSFWNVGSWLPRWSRW